MAAIRASDGTCRKVLSNSMSRAFGHSTSPVTSVSRFSFMTTLPLMFFVSSVIWLTIICCRSLGFAMTLPCFFRVFS